MWRWLHGLMSLVYTNQASIGHFACTKQWRNKGRTAQSRKLDTDTDDNNNNKKRLHFKTRSLPARVIKLFITKLSRRKLKQNVFKFLRFLPSKKENALILNSLIRVCASWKFTVLPCIHNRVFTQIFASSELRKQSSSRGLLCSCRVWRRSCRFSRDSVFLAFAIFCAWRLSSAVQESHVQSIALLCSHHL